MVSDEKVIHGPFLVTNAPNSRDAQGRMSHVWCVPILIRERDGSYCAFEGNLKIWGVKLCATINPPASVDTLPKDAGQ